MNYVYCPQNYPGLDDTTHKPITLNWYSFHIMKSFSQYLLILLALFLLPTVADAGVRISMSEQIDPAAEVVVETKIRYAGIHGYHHKNLGADLIRAGESKNITVLAVVPVFYDSVYTTAFHPAYYIDSSRSEKKPFILRTVQLPMLQPRSWATLLETGEPLREGGVGITAGNVKDHFYMILRYFLPAFDQAGGTEDLRRHLPLLEQLAAFVHTPAALANSQLNMRNYAPRDDKDKYIESVKRTEGSYRVELMYQLEAIKGWLSLDQSERLPMHDWLHKFHQPEYVYDQIMDDSDRQQVHALLKQSEKPSHPRSAEWLNPVTRVKFALTLNTRTVSKDSSSFGYRTRLYTDLNPRLGLERNKKYVKRCSPNFSNTAEDGWHLQRK